MNLIVLAGPTAVGKTAVAIDLAERLGTEIISADARQIFREMTIGTAKPTDADGSRVRHHLVSSRSIHENYNASTYGKEAIRLMDKLFQTHDNLILCGGSGLYISVVCEGFDEIPNIPSEVRRSLNEGYLHNGLTWLQEQIQSLDPQQFACMDQQNPQRIIRALEVKIGTGLSIGSFHTRAKTKRPFSVVKVGLDMDRTELYNRIDMRADQMIAAGLFDEARKLYPYRGLNALQTVGYQEIFDYLDGKYGWEEAIKLFKQHSRQYAKRQLTWFKRDSEFVWFHPDDRDRICSFVRQQIELLARASSGNANENG
jgi:tRNA dimethylallyltransferase